MEGLGPFTYSNLNNNNLYTGMNAGANNNIDKKDGFLTSFKSKVESVEHSIGNSNTFNTAMSALPFTRRIMTVGEDLDDKEKAKAIGYGAIGAMNLKEDFRDILTVFGRGESTAPKGYIGSFKFFQGTSAENYLQKSELGRDVLRIDKSLADTNAAYKLFNRLGITNEQDQYTKTIKWPWGTEEIERKCVKFTDVAAKDIAGSSTKAAVSSFSKEMVGYTLSRTTWIGLLVSSLLELPDMVTAAKNKDAKGVARSGLNAFVPMITGAFTSSLFSLKLPGKLGAAGSVIGLGLGIFLGGKAIDKVLPEDKQENIQLNNLANNPYMVLLKK